MTAPGVAGPFYFEDDLVAHAASRELFEELDRDGNGYLSPGELRSAQEVMLQTSSGMASLSDDLPRLLGSIDGNNDGRIDQDEWEEFVQSIYEVAGRKRFLAVVSRWIARLQDVPSKGIRPPDRLRGRRDERQRPSAPAAAGEPGDDGLNLAVVSTRSASVRTLPGVQGGSVPLGPAQMQLGGAIGSGAQVKGGASAGPDAFKNTMASPAQRRTNVTAPSGRATVTGAGANPLQTSAGIILNVRSSSEQPEAQANPTGQSFAAWPAAQRGKQAHQQDHLPAQGVGRSRTASTSVHARAAAAEGAAAQRKAADGELPEVGQGGASVLQCPSGWTDRKPGNRQQVSEVAREALQEQGGPSLPKLRPAPPPCARGPRSCSLEPSARSMASAVAEVAVSRRCSEGATPHDRANAIAEVLNSRNNTQDLEASAELMACKVISHKSGTLQSEVLEALDRAVSKDRAEGHGLSHSHTHTLPELEQPGPSEGGSPTSSPPKVKRATVTMPAIPRSEANAAPRRFNGGVSSSAGLRKASAEENPVDEAATEDDRLNEAAARIQAMQRGKAERRKQKAKVPDKGPAESVQAAPSEDASAEVPPSPEPQQAPARGRVEEGERLNQAAARIQAIQRGNAARRDFLAEKRSCIKACSTIQAAARARKSRRDVAALAQSAALDRAASDGEVPARPEEPPTTIDEAWELMTMQMGFVTNQLSVVEFVNKYRWCKETGLNKKIVQYVPQELPPELAGARAPRPDLGAAELAHLSLTLTDNPGMSDEELQSSLEMVQDHCRAQDQEDRQELCADPADVFGYAVYKRLVGLLTFYTHLDEEHILAHFLWVQTSCFELTKRMACVLMERCFQRCPGQSGNLLDQVIQNNDFLKVCNMGNLVDKNGRNGLPYPALSLIFSATVRKMPELLQARANVRVGIRGKKPTLRKHTVTPQAYSIPLAIRGLAGRTELSVLFEETWKAMPPGVHRSPLDMVMKILDNAIAPS